ncbi:hypothetical protein [Nakamurella leprariae]|uniref:Type II toxin-antitoxin system HicA family toxin n=1 Tax=Nakamurella leprariae TaxID=2803911 RepID=A0A938YKL0_9ACTN|nr:hypothetical protein [Nakamurella leprariae]MBM9469505.1 hypothetical protein [Nakamurella leprariae]
MTRRRDLVKKIADAAKEAGVPWVVAREGSNHTVYRLGELTIPVPRHTEVGEVTTREIYKECAPELGKDWWRK